MSRRRDESYPTDEQIERLAGQAFGDLGEMVPTTEHEVAKLEAEFGENLPAPPRFEPRAAQERSWSGPGSDRQAATVRQLSRVWRIPRAAAYSASAAVGALAASVAFLWFRSGPPNAVVISPSGESLPVPTTGAPKPPSMAKLSLPAECSDCCAGTACPDKPSQCVSGRRCVPCSVDSQRRYRLKLGSVQFDEAGRLGGLDAMELRLCVSVAGGKPGCVPANRYARESEPWRTLPQVVSAQDLLAGANVELRIPGKAAPVGSWSRPVAAGADVLCRGLSLPLEDSKHQRLGSVSVFLDDAQYVEIQRAAETQPLAKLAKSLSSSTVQATVHETTGKGDRRFVLSVGPVDAKAANHVRWQLLDAGLPATVTTGADLVGEPRPTGGN